MYLEWIDIDTAGNKFQRYACRSHCLTLLVHLFMLYCVDSFLPCSLDPIWTPEPRPLIYIILFEALMKVLVTTWLPMDINDQSRLVQIAWHRPDSIYAHNPIYFWLTHIFNFSQYSHARLCNDNYYIFSWSDSSSWPWQPPGDLSHQTN